MAAQEIYTTSLLTDANLQGYWRLNDNVTDSGPNGYNLTASGSPAYAAAQFANGIDLETGSSQYASIASASAPNLGGTGSFTIIGWWKPESHVQLNALVSKRGNANNGFIFYQNTGGNLQITIDGLTGGDLQSSGTMNDSTIYRVVGRYDSGAGTVAVFIDKTKTSQACSGTRSTNTVPFALGCDFQGGGDTATFFADGILDDVAYFDRAISDTDLDSLYDGTYGVSGGYFFMSV